MASSSVAVTSEDSANSNLATFMTPAESLPGELREPFVRESINAFVRGSINAEWSESERRGACREGSHGFVVGRSYIRGQCQQ